MSEDKPASLHSPPAREQSLAALENATMDTLVVGAGINGAVAAAAELRGADPDGDGRRQYLVDHVGRHPLERYGRSQGAEIEVLLSEAGPRLQLGYRVDGGHYVVGLHGFPTGARLRPFVKLLFPHDQVAFVRAWISSG